MKALWFYTAVLSFLFISCSGTSEIYRKVDDNISKGEFLDAINEVRQNHKAYGDKSTVLYNLDLGLLFHYAGEYDSSNIFLFAAEKEIEDLYTKSISQQALSFVINDNILPYDGEDFEKVLVNVFLALNYAQKGLSDEALVEARKVDLKLREYSRQYEEKNTYKEDAFIRYIAGVLYESGGEINDAFISYRKAYEAYDVYSKEYGTKAPKFILDDLVRTATKLSFTEEAEQYRELGGERYIKPLKLEGSIIVVLYTGKGPIKIEEKPKVTIPDSSGTLHTFQIALPKFVSRYKDDDDYFIEAISQQDTAQSTTAVAEDITAIAEKALDERLTLIYLKSGGRALLKFLASEKVKSEMKKSEKGEAFNFLGSLAVDLVVGATERADLRTWRTLPSEIQLARLNVPAGGYSISVRDYDRSTILFNDQVKVHSGKASFIIVTDVR